MSVINCIPKVLTEVYGGKINRFKNFTYSETKVSMANKISKCFRVVY